MLTRGRLLARKKQGKASSVSPSLPPRCSSRSLPHAVSFPFVRTSGQISRTSALCYLCAATLLDAKGTSCVLSQRSNVPGDDWYSERRIFANNNVEKIYGAKMRVIYIKECLVSSKLFDQVHFKVLFLSVFFFFQLFRLERNNMFSFRGKSFLRATADYEALQALLLKPRPGATMLLNRSCRGFEERLWSTALGFPRAA